MDKTVRKALSASVAFLALLAAWKIAVWFGPFNETLFPGPLLVGKAFFEMAASGKLLADTVASVGRLLAGFAVGTGLGIGAGIITAKARAFRELGGPVLNSLRFVPPLSLVPLAIMWLGIGEISKIALIAEGVFFPMWLNAIAGIASVEKKQAWAAESLGASKARMVREVVLPSSMPFLVAGARISLGVAFALLIAAEMAGAFSGLGFRISLAHQVFRVDKMIACILFLGVLGFAADRTLSLTAKKLIPWNRSWLND